MVQAAMISITGTQQLEGEEPESIQLVTEGSYCYEPGYIRFSYVETQMTGLEGVVTTFTIEDEKTVTLRRTGKVNSMIKGMRSVPKIQEVRTARFLQAAKGLKP